MRIRALLWVVAVGSSLVACSSSDDEKGNSTTSCATDPLSCPADKTCWLADANGSYACLTATTDKAQGATCQNMVGSAQCNAGLMCFPGQSGSAAGTCEPFCAKDNTCANGAQCASVTLINLPNAQAIHGCGPTGSGGTGGTGGGAGSGGAAGSGGSTGGAAGSGGGTGGSAGAPADAGAD